MASCGSTGTTFSVWLEIGPPHCGQPSHCSSTASACWSPTREHERRRASARKPARSSAVATHSQCTRGAAAARRCERAAARWCVASRRACGHVQKQWPHGATDRVPFSGSQHTLHFDIARRGRESLWLYRTDTTARSSCSRSISGEPEAAAPAVSARPAAAHACSAAASSQKRAARPRRAATAVRAAARVDAARRGSQTPAS